MKVTIFYGKGINKHTFTVMLSKNSRLLYNVGRRLCGNVHKASASTEADVNPFVYQDILEQEKKPTIEWKKLTGKSLTYPVSVLSYLTTVLKKNSLSKIFNI